MSAYIVSTDTIDLLISVVQRIARTDATIYFRDAQMNAPDYDRSLGDRLNFHTDAQRIGQILLDQNYRSVNARYDEGTTPERYRFRHVDTDNAGAGMDPAILAVGSLKCLAYQSCETDDYDQTVACAIHKAIESMVFRYLMNVHESPWGWTRDWATERIAAKRAKIARSMQGVH